MQQPPPFPEAVGFVFQETKVFFNQHLLQADVEFNQSKFHIHGRSASNHGRPRCLALGKGLGENHTPRKQALRRTWLFDHQLKFQNMLKTWGSCTESNNIILTTEAVKLPFTLLDYIITHELCHTRVKNHSKEFWAELARHIPNGRELDEKVAGMKL